MIIPNQQTKYAEKLQYIFMELCKSNISVLDLDNKQALAEISAAYSTDSDWQAWNKLQVESVKNLIMICNVLYNRTDMLVLPVEDGVYDLLLERYKFYDKNFQVGSAVVNFQSEIDKEFVKEGKHIKSPLVFYENPKDEARQDFRRQIQDFDLHGRLTDKDVIGRDPVIFYNKDQEIIEKRSHNTKHNHPDLVGTLDKCKFTTNAEAVEKGVFNNPDTTIIERDFFGKHIREGIIKPNQKIDLVLELKYDGISIEADCDSQVESARSRGDTGIGEASDMTPILYGYKFPNNTILEDRMVGVKFEAIIKKEDLIKFNRDRNYTYANCRTAIIGLFGASDAYKFRDYITLIPLAVDRNNVPEISNRYEEIELLNKLFKSHGEPLRHVYISGTVEECLYLIKKFAEEAKCARSYLDFMFDGIVISYTDEKIRAKLGRENYINKYSIALKFDPMEKLTTFLGYTYEVGQTGNICPMIHYSPVEFFGTIHSKSSGASLNRFNDLSLKPGDIITVTYRNDVMPYVTKPDCIQNRENKNPVCEFITTCPICGTPLVISTSGKSANCPNPLCKGRVVARMSNLLQKLNIKGFAESTISAIGVDSFTDLLNLREEEIAEKIGPINASNLIRAINILRTSPTEDFRLVGALGFTSIASQKWKQIFTVFTLKEFVSLMDTNPKIVLEKVKNMQGLGESTANVIVTEYPLFQKDIHTIINCMNVVDSKNSKIQGKSIRFTGCRNKQLEDLLRSKGFDADGQGSVTKNTDILIIPYDGFSSGKTAKVGENTVVVTITEFTTHMDKYL